MNEEYEKVHTMTGYWDGPRSGVANYKSLPHFYESLFDEKADDWSDTFILVPMDNETFQLVMEDWEIWKRWEQAYKQGETTIDTHPALPTDKERHKKIAPVLEECLKVNPETCIKVKADFDRGTGIEPLAVRWLICGG